MNLAQHKRILFLLSLIHCSSNLKNSLDEISFQKKIHQIYNILLFTHSLDGGLETPTETETLAKEETKLETSADDSKRTTIKLTS